ncbi:hypothetical protein VP01_2759g5 [Puccinia sorghi]|uniref:Uncharacterized protein n=1 Tax=Puccinia sorghi TaxID=27349 RepID=A0A0L6V2Z2_9BASI|nr:hypothetical protein VP01_2759g5 [Puccinia sorghi]
MAANQLTVKDQLSLFPTLEGEENYPIWNKRISAFLQHRELMQVVTLDPGLLQLKRNSLRQPAASCQSSPTPLSTLSLPRLTTIMVMNGLTLKEYRQSGQANISVGVILNGTTSSTMVTSTISPMRLPNAWQPMPPLGFSKMNNPSVALLWQNYPPTVLVSRIHSTSTMN